MSKNKKRISPVRKLNSNPRFQVSLFIILTGILIVLGYYILTSYACSLENANCEEQRQAQNIQSAADDRCVTILWLFKICF